MADDITDPEDENTLMIQGDFQRVTPQLTENHLYHIQKHMELQNSPNFMAIGQTAPYLTQQISEYNQQHIQQHMQMMQQVMAMMKAAQTQGGGGSSAGSEPGTGDGNKTSGQQPGVENMPGPMGQALNTQREGKVAKSEGQ
jgi:hypothetical protein